MSTVVVTGAAGLIGSESVKRFALEGFKVVGIDNDLRQWFFGKEASTLGNRQKLIATVPGYQHHDFDIRDRQAVENLFRRLGKDIALIIHTAAQPSHDWAARDPHADFSVNAIATLNLLEATRQFCPEAVFIFTSTNKVYGDTPNRLPLVELEKRWEIKAGHEYEPGISETMSIDQTKHSLFGASKVAADVLVQEYGNYFGMKTACFRGGCLTGPAHAGHGVARLSRLPHALHGGRHALSRVWLQRQTGARQHSQPRSGRSVLAVFPETARPARFITSAAAATRTVRCWKPLTSASKSAAAN